MSRLGCRGLALEGDTVRGADLDAETAAVAVTGKVGDNGVPRRPTGSPRGDGEENAQWADLEALIATGRSITFLHHDFEGHRYQTLLTGARLSLGTRRRAPRGQA